MGLATPQPLGYDIVKTTKLMLEEAYSKTHQKFLDAIVRNAVEMSAEPETQQVQNPPK